MPRPRKQLISIAETPYYHCIARCVRRAYLCGDDHYAGQNFDHRKDWLVERLKYLAGVFSIDVCAYAIMSNHYHLVLYVNAEQAQAWDLDEVCKRWRALFPASADNLIRLYNIAQANEQTDALKAYEDTMETWRSRMSDISWFMRCLNEFIARQANHEDNCSGRFWEGRFKSQALLDEHALLTCMAYVDLNPVRAKLADTPEESDFTSIQERIVDYAKQLPKNRRSSVQNQLIRQQQKARAAQTSNGWPQAKLKPLNGNSQVPLSQAIPFSREDYFKLVDLTGRNIRRDKRGSIDVQFLPILQRLGFEEASWIEGVI